MASTDGVCLTILLPLAALAVGGPLPAQQLPKLEPGQQVRVTAPAAGLANEHVALMSVTRDTIVIGQTRLRSEADSWWIDTVRTALPVAGLTSLEIFRGQRTSNGLATGLGAGIGLLAGAAVGVALAQDISGDDECGGMAPRLFCLTARDKKAATVALCGGVGIAIGFIIGHGIDASKEMELWEKVPLDRLRVDLVPLPGRRVGLGASLAF